MGTQRQHIQQLLGAAEWMFQDRLLAQLARPQLRCSRLLDILNPPFPMPHSTEVRSRAAAKLLRQLLGLCIAMAHLHKPQGCSPSIGLMDERSPCLLEVSKI